KLLVVGSYGGSMGGLPGLLRCNLDGTGCAFVDISGGHMASSTLTAVVDAARAKLLVVSATLPGIYECNLDGTGCTYATPGSTNPLIAAPVLDATHDELLVPVTDGSFHLKLYSVKP